MIYHPGLYHTQCDCIGIAHNHSIDVLCAFACTWRKQWCSGVKQSDRDSSVCLISLCVQCDGLCSATVLGNDWHLSVPYEWQLKRLVNVHLLLWSWPMVWKYFSVDPKWLSLCLSLKASQASIRHTCITFLHDNLKTLYALSGHTVFYSLSSVRFRLTGMYKDAGDPFQTIYHISIRSGRHRRWKICRSLIPVALILSTANCLWKAYSVGGVPSRGCIVALKEQQSEC